jgi:hypothetical protein
MTALDIISQARERLGDVKKQRWTDNRLLSIVSQGQVDICTSTGYLRKEVILSLIKGKTRFNLPKDCYSIKRVEYNGDLLPLHTRSDKDVPRAITADYTAYKSNLNMDKLEIQPAIAELSLEVMYFKGDSTEDSLRVDPLFGVVTSSTTSDLAVDPVYGVIVNTEQEFIAENYEPSEGYGEIAGTSDDIYPVYFPDGQFGVTVDADYDFSTEKFGFISEVNNGVISGGYGIVTEVSAYSDAVHVYYVAIPDKLRYITATLVIPEIWEDLLIRYTVGTALQDDNDANNITRGEGELQKYIIKLQEIKDISSKDFSANTSTKYETNYRRV